MDKDRTGADLWIRGGTLVTEGGLYRADIFIRKGKIAWIGRLAPEEPGPASSAPVLDATGCYVLPGVIDVHVHFRDPGLTHKEDFLTGSAAAACGGVTTVLDMPNTVPPVSSAALLAEKKALLAGRSYVDFGLYGVITEGNARELAPLAEAGAIALKLFLGPTTGDIQAPSIGELLEIFRDLPRLGLPVVVHAEDRSVIEAASSRVRAAGGQDYEAFLDSRPRWGELLATETAARLAEASGVPVHIAHVALREALDILRRYKKRGVPITGETCPPYLYFSREDFQHLGREFKILPPVRDVADREALWQALAEGLLDVVATDHAPHLPSEKEGAPDLWATPGGTSGVETLVPLMLDAVHRGLLSFPRLVQVLSAQPARIFGLYPRKGCLQPGADGDLTVVNMQKETVVDQNRLHSKPKTSLFHGRRLQGAVEATILRGELVARCGELVAEQPPGRFLRPLPPTVRPAGRTWR